MAELVKLRRLSMVCIAAIGLAACEDGGGFPRPSANGQTAPDDRPLPANAPNQVVQQGNDIERPDIFEVSDRGLWDGRPSLGGVWVAHPDVTDPERVLITNTENGRTTIGALFRRERENPGPLLQVSSDAADALGLLAGAPTPMSVVALRRAEVEAIVPDPAANPVVAGLEAPVNIQEAPLDPVDAPDEVDAPEDDAAGIAAVVLPPALEAATAAAEQGTAAASAVAAETTDTAADIATGPIDVSAVLAAPAPLPEGLVAQIGIFSVEANAVGAVTRITDAGIAAQVLPQDMGGRTVWRVVAGPLDDASVVEQLKELGFVDAFIIAEEE